MTDTFLKVEKVFTDEIYRKTQSQTDLNFCCDDEDEVNIMKHAGHIKRIPEFSSLSDSDLFFVLIFMYYLSIDYQTDDWLNTNFLINNLQNKELGYQLYTKLYTFAEVQDLFTNEMNRKTHSQRDLNLCCDDHDEENMINMANTIIQIPEFSGLSLSDIFIVLIFIYYSLRFNEQTEDWLNTEFLINNLQNKELGNQLYLQITTGDIMFNGVNLSSSIRRYIMELNGGKKSKNRKNKKSRKSKIRKSRKTKTKKSRKSETKKSRKSKNIKSRKM
jgi:hypothetical protein